MEFTGCYPSGLISCFLLYLYLLVFTLVPSAWAVNFILPFSQMHTHIIMIMLLCWS
ncbi:hypothetical protein BJX99DRAFT_48764 [Aspergillus californicus]